MLHGDRGSYANALTAYTSQKNQPKTIETAPKQTNITLYISPLSHPLQMHQPNQNQNPKSNQSVSRSVSQSPSRRVIFSSAQISPKTKNRNNAMSPLLHLHSVADDWLPSNLNWRRVRLMCLFQNVKSPSYFWLWLRHGYSVNSHKQNKQTSKKKEKYNQSNALRLSFQL